MISGDKILKGKDCYLLLITVQREYYTTVQRRFIKTKITEGELIDLKSYSDAAATK